MSWRAAQKQRRKRATSSVQLEFDFAASARLLAQAFAELGMEEDDTLLKAALLRLRGRKLREPPPVFHGHSWATFNPVLE